MSESVVHGSGVARAIASLDRLHPTAITDPAEIRRMLERMQRERVTLWRGMNRRIDRETATIEEAVDDGLVLLTRNFEPGEREAIFLNFTLEQQPYFFSAPFETDLGKGRIRVRCPGSIYCAERRSRTRRPPGEGDPRRVALVGGRARSLEAEVEDASPEGMGVRLPDGQLEALDSLGTQLRVRLLDGPSPGRELHGEVRNRSPLPTRRGWTRIGLDVSPAPRAPGLTVERREQVLPTTPVQRAQRRWKVASAGLRVVTDRALSALGRRPRLPAVRIVDYANEQGETIRGIVDSWGDTRGATAVVIPPAWGRTKETLMPLAATLVAGFRAAREPVVVLRFDGIRKRGESHNDPGCREPGKEHHRFTFSQGVRDIVTTLDFLERSPEYGPRKVLLVSFSAASIESRRAVATDPRIDGWVCVVGAADTQSMMRVISGGVDYGVGFENGARFGLQEILGVEVDMDHAGFDAIATKLAYLDDARKDMARIHVPVTWIHGRHDAWMSADRARDILSRGNPSGRRFLEVPTGHMLRTSAEALETFQLVATELGRMALGRTLPPALPDLGELSRRHSAERTRLGRPATDVRGFWRDYLVGRDGSIGIELMTSIVPYREFMRLQIEQLQLRPGDRVADLGSGTSSFALALREGLGTPTDVSVIELDYVREGLERGRARLAASTCDRGPRVAFVEADLDPGGKGVSVPAASEAFDAVIASLLLSYMERPLHVLTEMHRILKPGGRLVVSSLRRDADMSKIFVDGLAELRQAGTALVPDGDLDRAARAYMNEASRLLDLEESGVFRFWSRSELVEIVDRSGFVVTASQECFGAPPQAIVISATRR